MGEHAKNDHLYKQAMDLRLMSDAKLRESGYAPYTDKELGDGIWTMTDAEFQEELRKACEAAWDECESAKYEIRLNESRTAWGAVKDNPYREVIAKAGR